MRDYLLGANDFPMMWHRFRVLPRRPGSFPSRCKHHHNPTRFLHSAFLTYHTTRSPASLLPPSHLLGDQIKPLDVTARPARQIVLVSYRELEPPRIIQARLISDHINQPFHTHTPPHPFLHFAPSYSSTMASTEELSRKYSSQLSQLQAIFPTWDESDLAFTLQDSKGNVEEAVLAITEGASRPVHCRAYMYLGTIECIYAWMS